MPIAYTRRGYAIYDEFFDIRRNTVLVQHSSLSGQPAVWVFCRNGEDNYPAHLNLEQAKRLRAALDEWIGEQEKKSPPRPREGTRHRSADTETLGNHLL